MDADRLGQQLAFIVEIDRLKSVLRQTRLLYEERYENTAEHSWHLAMLALVLAEHADEPVDLLRVLKLVLVHDIVEIDAGDTFCYDAQGVLDKAQREQLAAERLFGLLPADQCAELRALWEEFEARSSPESRFANALDRLMPLLHNYHGGGGSWKAHAINNTQVYQRMAPIGEASQTLGALAAELIRDAIGRGYIAQAAEPQEQGR